MTVSSHASQRIRARPDLKGYTQSKDQTWTFGNPLFGSSERPATKCLVSYRLPGFIEFFLLGWDCCTIHPILGMGLDSYGCGYRNFTYTLKPAHQTFGWYLKRGGFLNLIVAFIGVGFPLHKPYPYSI